MSDIHIDLGGKQQADTISAVLDKSRNGFKSEASERGLNHLLVLAEYAELMESRHSHQNMGENCKRPEDGQRRKDKELQASSQTHVLSKVLHGRTRLSNIRRLARMKDVSSMVNIHQNQEVREKNSGALVQNKAKIICQPGHEKIKIDHPLASRQQGQNTNRNSQYLTGGHNLHKPDLLQKEQNQILYLVNGGFSDCRHGVYNPSYYPVNMVAVPPDESSSRGCIVGSPVLNHWNSSRAIARQRRLLRFLERRKQARKRCPMAIDNRLISGPHQQVMLCMPPYGQLAPHYALPVSVGWEQSLIVSKEAEALKCSKPLLSKGEQHLLCSTILDENKSIAKDVLLYPSATPSSNLSVKDCLREDELSGGQKHTFLVNANTIPQRVSPDSKKVRLTHIRREARLKSRRN